jgi:ribosomal protein L37AE/L43A
MDVEFAVLKNTREVLVWREISNAREQSKFICAQCSKDKLIRRSNNVANMLCEECSRNTGVLSKTGTWLDRY